MTYFYNLIYLGDWGEWLTADSYCDRSEACWAYDKFRHEWPGTPWKLVRMTRSHKPTEAVNKRRSVIVSTFDDVVDSVILSHDPFLPATACDWKKEGF